MDLTVTASALVIAFLWAINTVIYKYGMTRAISYKTVIVIGSFTYFMAMIGFALYHNKSIAQDFRSLHGKDIMLIMIGSFIGTFVATILFMELLEKHDSSLVTALTYTAPMFVFLLSFVILREELDLIKLFGIFVTVIGIVIISYNNARLHE